jgi:hypothetical protein
MRVKPNYLAHAETEAAMLLAGAVADRARDGISLRELGRRLEYKQPVVLSHMATGRVPIPIDRALEIARTVGLSPRKFVLAVLEQRHPGIDWSMIVDPQTDFAGELETIAGSSLDELPAERRSVLREAVLDPHPSRRWLSTAELPAVDLLRQIRPTFRTEGLSQRDKLELRKALAKASE